MLVDSHCHLDHLDLAPHGGDLGAALDTARAEGVDGFLCIGADPAEHERVLALGAPERGIWTTVGIHPLAVPRDAAALASQLADVERRCAHPAVVGLGETGLDHYRVAGRDEPPPAALQREAFAAHLRLGARTGLPVVVHTRSAAAETLEVIAAHGDPSSAGVLHCFAEDWDTAVAAMDLGYMISISGIVTFRSADALRDLVRRLPLDRLLVETDSPWLAPAPHRGRSNEPRLVRRVAECIAELRGMSLSALAEATTANFHRLFPRARRPQDAPAEKSTSNMR